MKVSVQGVPESYNSETGRLTFTVATEDRDEAHGVTPWKGKLCTFVVSDSRPRSTGPRGQENCFRGWCRFITAKLSTPEKPMSFETVCHFFKRQCYRTHGYPTREMPDGQIILDSNAVLTMTEEIALLDTVEEWCKAWLPGVELPKYREKIDRGSRISA